ncbi:hypothetical protein AFB00_14320 [Pseudonocardia sp. HH130630-07]|nr:hypothetical protein AFB00_14320 [Pseudonocardia sp. HH130630-07]
MPHRSRGAARPRDECCASVAAGRIDPAVPRAEMQCSGPGTAEWTAFRRGAADGEFDLPRTG